ncbi:MAG: aldehyde ferredoxin oxidoreductase N-terminal domain-containing protein [Candidatus Kariarchaeaceae archaeon]
MIKSLKTTTVLEIDLSEKTTKLLSRDDLREEWLGGTGIATKLLTEYCDPQTDPLGKDNTIIFSVGPLTGAYACATKTVAMFKSPLTGELGESHAGGRSGVAIRFAGLDAIVITGKSDRPVFLTIDGHKVYFNDASVIWGVKSDLEMVNVLRGLQRRGAGRRAIMWCGRAGEKQIPTAMITTDQHRHFGRLGLGAVFGSKNLKAIIIHGKADYVPEDMKKYREVYDQVHELTIKKDHMSKYHNLGTSVNILPLNALGGLPTRNFKEGRFEFAEQISGETMAMEYMERKTACSACPVGCIHIATAREYDEKYDVKLTTVSYDYEPLYALGSNLAIGSPVGFIKLMHSVEVAGLDAMSTGLALSWATEAYEKAVLSEEHLLDVVPTFGNAEGYIKMVNYMLDQPNEFYSDLGKGVKFLGNKYGGADYAIQAGGLGLAGYSTGLGSFYGTLVGMRHSHLDNAGYSFDQKNMDQPQDPVDLAEKMFIEETERQMITSLNVCLFSRKIFGSRELVLNCLHSLGFTDWNNERLDQLAKNIMKLKHSFRTSCGFDLDKQKLPLRLHSIETPRGVVTPEALNLALTRYKELISEL